MSTCTVLFQSSRDGYDRRHWLSSTYSTFVSSSPAESVFGHETKCNNITMTHPALDADWGTNAEALARVAARNATFIIVNQMGQCRDIMRSKCKRTAFRRFVIEGAVVVVGVCGRGRRWRHAPTFSSSSWCIPKDRRPADGCRMTTVGIHEDFRNDMKIICKVTIT